jgi:hypothetical protein
LNAHAVIGLSHWPLKWTDRLQCAVVTAYHYEFLGEHFRTIKGDDACRRRSLGIQHQHDSNRGEAQAYDQDEAVELHRHEPAPCKLLYYVEVLRRSTAAAICRNDFIRP